MDYEFRDVYLFEWDLGLYCLTTVLLAQISNDLGDLELLQSDIITSRFLENEENMTRNSTQLL